MTQAYINPDKDAWTAFKALPDDTVVHMLNLVKLKPLAEYPEDHPDHGKGLTGAEAYRTYGRTTAPILKALGGRIVWSGKPQVMLTGPGSEAWDLAFIAEYPNTSAFVAMLRDPQYREFVKHRTAGVADSRLVRFAPQAPGERFGE